MVAEMGQCPGDFWAWRIKDNKSWTELQAHFIEDQANSQEQQQLLRQYRYGVNDLVGIEEAFTKLAKSKS